MWRMCNNAGDFNSCNDLHNADNPYTALINKNVGRDNTDTNASDNVYNANNLYAKDADDNLHNTKPDIRNQLLQ